MKIVFSKQALNDFSEFKKDNHDNYQRIKLLLVDIEQGGSLGKPEKLKYTLSGYESRRINRKDRLVYQINKEENSIIVISCRYHYEK